MGVSLPSASPVPVGNSHSYIFGGAARSEAAPFRSCSCTAAGTRDALTFRIVDREANRILRGTLHVRRRLGARAPRLIRGQRFRELRRMLRSADVRMHVACRGPDARIARFRRAALRGRPKPSAGAAFHHEEIVSLRRRRKAKPVDFHYRTRRAITARSKQKRQRLTSSLARLALSFSF
jgi:hypothetical protein